MIRGRVSRISKKLVFLLFLLFFNLFIFYSSYPVFGLEQNTILEISPSSQTVNVSDSFFISVNCTPGSPVKGFELELSFNPSLIYAIEVTEGDFFDGYDTFFNSGVIDNNAGKITNVFSLIIGQGNVSSPGSLIHVLFTAKSSSGTSSLSFSSIGEWTGVTDEEGYLPISVINGSVSIIGGSENPIVIPNEPINNTEPENTPPVILNKPIGPVYVEIGIEYNYKISGYDNEGEKIRIMFDWGDGNFSNWSEFVSSNESVNLSHVFNSVSYYLLRAKAQDESGLNSSWSKSLTIIVSSPNQRLNNSSDPEVNIDYEENATQNQTIKFTASNSSNESINIITYIWDFGDDETDFGKSVEHIYKEPGVYTVNLTMIDEKGSIYTKTMIVIITESIVDEIKRQKTSNENSISYLLIINLIFIIIFVIVIFIYLKKFIKSSTGYKKHGLFNLLSKRSLDKINKKIEKINFDLKDYDDSNYRSILKSKSFDDHRFKDINVFKDNPYNDNESRGSLTKSDWYSRNGKIDKLLYKESLKSDDDLDESGYVDIDYLVDKLLENKFNEKSFNQRKKINLVNNSKDDTLDNIEDFF